MPGATHDDIDVDHYDHDRFPDDYDGTDHQLVDQHDGTEYYLVRRGDLDHLKRALSILDYATELSRSHDPGDVDKFIRAARVVLDNHFNVEHDGPDNVGGRAAASDVSGSAGDELRRVQDALIDAQIMYLRVLRNTPRDTVR